MRKLIIFIVIVVILFIGVVFHSSLSKDKVAKRQQTVQNLINKDGGQGMSIKEASEHNNMFQGFLEDTLNFEHHKATIAGLKHQWDTSVKPNQVLPKPTYDKSQETNNNNQPAQTQQPVQQPTQTADTTNPNSASGSSTETVTYSN